MSIIHTSATNASINGIFKHIAEIATAPPSARDPVSPINTFAGCILNIKNPKQDPATVDESNFVENTAERQQEILDWYSGELKDKSYKVSLYQKI